MVTQQGDYHPPIIIHGERREEETGTAVVVTTQQGGQVSPEKAFELSIHDMAMSVFTHKTVEEQGAAFENLAHLFTRYIKVFNLEFGRAIRRANEQRLFAKLNADFESMEDWLKHIGVDADIIKSALLYIDIEPFLLERKLPVEAIFTAKPVQLEAIRDLQQDANQKAAAEATHHLPKKPSLEQRQEKEEEELKKAEPEIRRQFFEILATDPATLIERKKARHGELIRAVAYPTFTYDKASGGAYYYGYIPEEDFGKLASAGLMWHPHFEGVPDATIDVRNIPAYVLAVKEGRDPATCLNKKVSTASPTPAIRPTTFVTGTLGKQSHEKEPEEFPVWQGDDEEYEAEFAEDGEEQEI